MDAAAPVACMIDVHAVAAMLDCSTQHVYRLSSSGKMPRPVRLMRLVRWNRDALKSWISDGCPAVESSGEQEDSDSETAVGNSSVKLAEEVTAQRAAQPPPTDASRLPSLLKRGGLE